MTVATVQGPSLSIASASCSDSESLFSSLLSIEQQEFSISISAGAVSFDWSDFPVVHQYNEDMFVPPPVSSSAPSTYKFCSSPLDCSAAPLLSSWEVDNDDDNDDDDTTSFSVSSDEETVNASFALNDDFRTRNPNKKGVKFADVVEIRSFPVVLGDHPCSHGLALELGWEHQDLEVVDFELYESSRRFQRRHMNELRLSYWERRQLLVESTGLSEQELLLQEQRAWREQHWPSESDKTASDKPPVLPQMSCSQEAATQRSVLRKVSSTKTLSALTV